MIEPILAAYFLTWASKTAAVNFISDRSGKMWLKIGSKTNWGEHWEWIKCRGDNELEGSWSYSVFQCGTLKPPAKGKMII